MNQRAYALDALRGYAIITMVLSATIASGVLPAWMYHAQEPPPSHAYNAMLTGITWVDLVFPFFLFSMGAAFPFSIGKRIEKGENSFRLVWDAIKRGLQLTFFAIFLQHLYPYVLSAPQDPRSWGLAILAFTLLFPMFMRIPLKMPAWLHLSIKLLAYALAFILMTNINYADGRTWNLDFSNIIILLLANMAVFGSVAYICTRQYRKVRIGILICLMAIFLSASVDGSWAQVVFNFTPFPWMYKFTYLKYLFIVIPGSIAGEYLVEWMKGRNQENNLSKKKGCLLPFGLLLLTVLIIVLNLCFLYARMLVVNFLVSAILLVIGCYYLNKAESSSYQKLWKNLFYAGGYLLILGLCFESFEGGIKKDPPTYSYYFVTSGLAFMALLAFNIVCDYYGKVRSTKFLVMSGQNPMIAYAAGDLLIMPIFGLLGITPYLSYFSANAYLGFLRGALITTLAVLITMFFTRIKWFWRT